MNTEAAQDNGDSAHLSVLTRDLPFWSFWWNCTGVMCQIFCLAPASVKHGERAGKGFICRGGGEEERRRRRRAEKSRGRGEVELR